MRESTTTTREIVEEIVTDNRDRLNAWAPVLTRDELFAVWRRIDADIDVEAVAAHVGRSPDDLRSLWWEADDDTTLDFAYFLCADAAWIDNGDVTWPLPPGDERAKRAAWPLKMPTR
jgi:hypothetical protein